MSKADEKDGFPSALAISVEPAEDVEVQLELLHKFARACGFVIKDADAHTANDALKALFDEYDRPTPSSDDDEEP